MLNVDHITAADELFALVDDWNRLAARQPLRSFAWHANWLQHYQSSRRGPFALVARDEQQQIRGIAPWCWEDSGGTRTIQWLASGEVCSDYQGLLTTDQDSNEVAEAFADWLALAATSESGRWDLLRLDSVSNCDAGVNHLIGHLWSGGCTVHRSEGPNCWRIELPDDWETYVAMLSKSHRKQVRRIERRMLDTARATYHSANNESQLERGMEILVDLHQRRRISLGQPGCFAQPEFTEFLHAAAADLLCTNQLRLSWVEIEGAPAAVEFQLAGTGVTYAYQAGVNPDLLADEPGRIINVATIRQAIEEGQSGFDFLRGDEAYKGHWRAQPRPTTTYRVVPQRTSAQVRHGLWLAGDNVKHWVKSGLELTGMR